MIVVTKVYVLLCFQELEQGKIEFRCINLLMCLIGDGIWSQGYVYSVLLVDPALLLRCMAPQKTRPGKIPP